MTPEESALTVLVVEGESALRDLMSFVLERTEFSVVAAATGEQARGYLNDFLPDLIVLDRSQPGLDGTEWVRHLREDRRFAGIPVILIAARDEGGPQPAPDSGIDDYLAKPFSPRELVACVKAVLRRRGIMAGEAVELGGIALDPRGHRVMVDRRPLALTPLEYRLLEFFLTHPDRVYDRGQLLSEVWERPGDIDERTVDVHIRRLRKALERHGRETCIETVRGCGYRFSGRATDPTRPLS